MKLPERIYLNIEIMGKHKIITNVLLPNMRKESELIVDTGASFTLISHELFKKLKLPVKDRAITKVIGLNSVEDSYSTLIPSFKIGNIDLGEVRVAVAELHKNFQESVILGMNILGCFNFNLSISNKEIELRPRYRGNTVVWGRCLKVKDTNIEDLLNLAIENK